ncbi:unnamed protein product [Blepharisma stoltei]|uniref:Uncharacterized protein n=1 Tax=Blepharisma stoltei TaxID=1481888 RepID=A0AAU9KAK6_9CILI|nr:unnamed protein product [Blepharisma stoltei]
MHLACQKNLETPKLSGNGRLLGSFLPLPLSFDVAKFLTSQMHHRKRTIFFIAFGLPKNLETPKLSGNGRLGSFVKIFSGRLRMAP